MSDDEDCVDLPKIFVNSSAHDANDFSIPSADELARIREREDENERRLRALRERQSDDDVTAPAAPARHDSSSSESEAVLASAVRGLSVRPERPAPPRRRAAELLAQLALAPALGARARDLLRLAAAPRRRSALVRHAAALVAADGEAWADDEVMAAGALLAAAALAEDAAAPRAAALRALHALLEQRASAAQAERLGLVLQRALDSPRLHLELSDALRAGGAACGALAGALEQAALAALLGAGADGWARLAPADAYVALQLLGRRLAAGAGAGAAELPPAPALGVPPDAQCPDKLRVLVSASKLRLLFGAD